MKNLKAIIKHSLIILLLLCGYVSSSQAQSQEAQQLLLNVEKLTQFKNILSDMKNGYQVISTGYNAIKDVSEGNFSLHEVFLDGLMLVNPEVKKYSRILDIVKYQQNIVNEYKSAFSRFKSSGNFSTKEITYLSNVYKKIFDESADNLDQLTNVITASKLRMSDDERLQAIDEIFADTQDKLVFLRNFNKETSILNIRRAHEKQEILNLQKIYEP